MSQAKVDKRKYEKKHRKEIERKKKIKTTVTCVVAALIIGSIIGVPLGIRIYRSIPKFVGDSTLEAFVANYIDENYASDIAVLNNTEESTEESAEENSEESAEDAVKNALEDAAGAEVEKVDSDNVDEVLDTGSEEEQTTSESEE